MSSALVISFKITEVLEIIWLLLLFDQRNEKKNRTPHGGLEPPTFRLTFANEILVPLV